MRFGARAAESTSNSSGDYIRYFKNKETRLRFLEEPGDWTEVWMHFSQSKMRDYPCTGSRTSCPGCTSENEREAKASKRYLVNALVDGYVNLWKIPASLKEDVDYYFDKSGGTITDRDYTVLKKQDDGGTKYSIDREERDKIDLAPHQAKRKDHQQALMEAFVEAWGYEPTEEGAPTQTVRHDPQREEHVIAQIEREVAADKGTDDPPSEPQAASADGAEEDIEITEDALRAMSATQIKALFVQCGIPAPETENVDRLADTLIGALS